MSTHARRKFHWIWLLALVAACAALAAGCGDDGGDADPASADGGISSDDVAESAENVDEDFANLVKAFENATYSVTYSFGGTGMNTEGMDEMTLASDGSRTAYRIGDGMGLFTDAEGKSVVCSGDAGQPTCMESPMDQAGAQLGFGASIFAFTESLGEDIGEVERVDDREIAGRTANCWTFQWEWLGAKADATSCMDSETGVPLSMEWGGESADGESGSFSMEATAFSDSPTDADLSPPAEAQSMDEMLQDAGVSAEQLQEMQEQMEGAQQ